MQNALNSACHIVREQYKPYIHISICLYIYKAIYNYRGFPGDSDGKESDAVQETWVRPQSQQDPLDGNPFQHSCLENSVDRGVWLATVHGVAKSQRQLSN